MVRIADTSALYAFLDLEDDHHGKALEDIQDPEPIAVPSEILVETVDLVGYRQGKAAARAALEDIMGLAHTYVADPVHVAAVRSVFEDAAGKLSLADAFVVQTCRALGAEPLAYDKAIHAAVG